MDFKIACHALGVAKQDDYDNERLRLIDLLSEHLDIEKVSPCLLRVCDAITIFVPFKEEERKPIYHGHYFGRHIPVFVVVFESEEDTYARMKSQLKCIPDFPEIEKTELFSPNFLEKMGYVHGKHLIDLHSTLYSLVRRNATPVFHRHSDVRTLLKENNILVNIQSRQIRKQEININENLAIIPSGVDVEFEYLVTLYMEGGNVYPMEYDMDAKLQVVRKSDTLVEFEGEIVTSSDKREYDIRYVSDTAMENVYDIIGQALTMWGATTRNVRLILSHPDLDNEESAVVITGTQFA